MAFLFFVLKLLLLVLVAGGAFAAGYVVALRRVRAAAEAMAAPLALGSPAREPVRVSFAREAVEGTSEWSQEMRGVGERMREAGVRIALFAHGSFVGDDPLAIAQVVDDALPVLPEIGRALRGFTRAQISRLVGDLSNFPRDYVESFGRATGVPTTDFVWSGENHHAARIQGAVRLARTLVLHGGGALKGGDRVLLVGHSHAGQLFAILSQLLARAHGYEELLGAAHGRGEDVGALEEHLGILRRCSIDVVTFGTPPRYAWARAAGFRLLHVVNHRGEAPRGPSLLGLFHTKGGDYVHQLGGHGSDFPAPKASERGVATRAARRDPRRRPRTSAPGSVSSRAAVRVPDEGQTVLVVHYGDAAALVPNFLATGLGHAAYTRRDAMLFHARLVATELLSAPRPGPRGRPRGAREISPSAPSPVLVR